MRGKAAISTGAVAVSAALACAGFGAVPATAVPATAAPAAQPAPMGVLYTSLYTGGKLTVHVRSDEDPYAKYVVDAGDGMRLDTVSSDGLRIAGTVAKSSHVKSVRLDGSGSIEFNRPGTELSGAEFSSDGTRMFMTGTEEGTDGDERPRLYVAPSDGSTVPQPLFDTEEPFCDRGMSASTVGLYVFTRRPWSEVTGCSLAAPAVMLYDERGGVVTPVMEKESSGVPVPVWDENPDISPDGKRLAEVTGGKAERVTVQDLATGSRFSWPTDQPVLRNPDWSPDGRKLAFGGGVGRMVNVMDVATGHYVSVGGYTGVGPTWRPQTVRPATSVRVSGQTALDTSIAASRFKYDEASSTLPTARKALAAVLTRDDTFYDGLAGAGLAGAKGGPMLLTPGSGLTPASSTELKRILRPGSTVYLLGGPQALSSVFETQVRALGFVPRRLAGATVADTAVAVARGTTSTPTKVFVATAKEYYDALAAGGAIGAAPNTALVVTWGDVVPAATLRYLSGLDRAGTSVVAVGGPARRALLAAKIPMTTELVGSDAPDTARLVAENAFESPVSTAVATTNSWQDALTGGALISGHGPLLLSSRDQLSRPTAAYLVQHRKSLNLTVLLGGKSALDPRLDVLIAGAIADEPFAFRTLQSPNGTVRVPLDRQG